MAIEQYPPGIQSDDPLLADLERRLRAVLDFDLTAVEPIVAGFNNNRLLRLRADDGRQAIANAMVDLGHFAAELHAVLPSAPGFESFCVLQHLFWCGIHLSLTTPGYLARKRFANPDLDVAAVTADQVTQFRRRLVVAEAALQTLSMGSA